LQKIALNLILIKYSKLLAECMALIIVPFRQKNVGLLQCTVKLGYNEQLGSRDRPNLFVITGVRYNRVDLCCKMVIWTEYFVRYNRVCYNWVSLHCIWIVYYNENPDVSWKRNCISTKTCSSEIQLSLVVFWSKMVSLGKS